MLRRRFTAISGIAALFVLTFALHGQTPEGTWATKHVMLTGRTWLRAEVVDGKVYAIGGTGGGCPAPGVLPTEAYNPFTNTWTSKAALPQPSGQPGNRHAFASAVVAGKIYAFGGSNCLTFFDDVQAYDPITNSWSGTVLKAMPSSRANGAAAAVNGKIYLIGGVVTPGGPLAGTLEYDPSTGVWTPKAPMLTHRSDPGIAVINNKIYVAGGAKPTSEVLTTVEVYDPATDKWTSVADLSTPRLNPALGVLNGLLYVFGGANASYLAINSGEVYDPALNVWTAAPPLPAPRIRSGAAVLAGVLYVMGGQSDTVTGNPETFAFTPPPVAAATTLTTAAVAGVYGGTASLQATLTSGGSPVVGKTVSFKLKGTGVGTATTASGGVATLSNASLAGINASATPYASVIAANFAGDASYLASSGSADLTVDKAPPSIFWSPVPVTYGTPLGGAQLTATASATVNGSVVTVPGTFTFSPAAGAVLNAGNQTLSVTFVPTDTTNFSTVTPQAVLTVAAAPLTVKANNALKEHSAPLPALTASYTGFVNGDTSSMLGGTLALVTPATVSSAVGTYAITPSGLTSLNYAISFANGTLTVRDTTPPALSLPVSVTEQVIATVPVGSNPYGVGVNPTTNRIYAGNFASNNVSVIDGATNGVIATIPVGREPHAVAVNAVTNRIYVANYSGHSISVIDGATSLVAATIPVPNSPRGVAVDAATNRVYVATRDGSSLQIIDGNTNTIVGSGAPGAFPFGVDVHGRFNRVYVANLGGNTVSVLDTASGASVGSVQVGDSPSGVRVDTPTNRIFVTNSMSNLSVINAATQSVIATVTVGTAPGGVGVNSSTQHVYVANGNSNTVSVIDGGSYAQLASVAVGASPLGVAVNPTTGRVYVTNYVSNTLSVIEDSIVVTAEATSSAGAVVSYAVTASDIVDGSLTPACTPSSGSTFPVGDTTVTCSATDTAGNTTNATFKVTVRKGNQTITFGALSPRTFGDPDFTVAATASSGLLVSFAASGNCTVSASAVHLTGAGTCTITASQSGDGSFNAAPDVPQTFSIAKAPLTVKADNKMKEYAAPLPLFTASYAGFVNAEMSNVLGGALTFGTAATASSPLGTYTITPSGLTSSNYSITFVNGTLTVQDTTPPALTLPANISRAALGSAGTAISYTASATDAVDGAVAVTCTPASGSTFALAQTTVNCSATDAHVNKASGTFTVTVTDSTPPALSLPTSVTAQVVATVPVGANPYPVAVNPVTKRVYVGNFSSNTVSVLDFDTSAVVATIPVGVNPHGIAVNPGKNKIYVANYGSHTVSVIDGATNLVAATIAVPNAPRGVAVNANDRVFVTTRDSDSLQIIDGNTNTVVRSGVTGAYPFGVDVYGGINRVYVANLGGSTVSVLDTATGASLGTVHVGFSPFGVSIDKVTNRIFVTNSGDGTVSVVDAATQNVVATVPVGPGPGAVRVSSTLQHVYVATGNNTVSVIEAGSYAQLASIPVGASPSGVAGTALNSTTGRIYVTNYGSDTVSVIDESIVVTADAASSAGAVVTYAVTANDVVDGSVTPACSPSSGSIFPVGDTTVTCSATDIAGNTASASFIVRVTKANQTITLAALGNKTFGDPDFVLAATASSGLPVSFAASGDCSVSDGAVHLAGAGSCTITASQAGDANYHAAPPVLLTFPIAKASQTITFGSLSNKTYGDADFTMNATADSGLTVTFTANGNCTVSGNTAHVGDAGSCTITASQGGNADYTPASIVSQTFLIAKAGSMTTVACGVGPFTYTGVAHMPCTATVSGAGGLTEPLTVDYSDNVNAGTATAKALYVGDANHTASSDEKTFTIGRAAANVVVSGYTGVYDSAPHGASGSATGVLGEDLGELLTITGTFTNVSGGTATWTFAGNTNYKSASGTAAIVITQAAQGIDFPDLTDKSDVDPDFLLGATATSGLPVTYTSVSACTIVSGPRVHLTGAGTCSVTASQAGNGNYQAAPTVTRTFTIRDTTPPTVAIASPGTDIVFGASPATVDVRASDVVGVNGVKVNGVAASLVTGTAQSGTWRASVPVTVGASNALDAVATDAALNNTSAALTVDGDGIPAALDSNKNAFTNDFSDIPLGGKTSGTITARGGWTVNVTDGAFGVFLALSGSGTIARVDTCAASGAEQVELDGNGETAGVDCVDNSGFNATTTVKAITATVPAAKPTIIVRDSSGTIQVSLSPGQETSIGSPVTAAPSNQGTILVELLDSQGVAFGSFELERGESVNAQTSVGPNGLNLVTMHVLVGSVSLTIGSRTIPISAGELPRTYSPDVVPPVIATPGDLIREASGPGGEAVTFSVTALDDVDGKTAVSCTPGSGTTFPIATTQVMCTSSDKAGNVATATFNVTVRDTTAPAITDASPSTTTLWPPNHNMVDVAFVYNVNDAVDPTPACALRVSSNEPVNGTGDGDAAPDWEIIDAHSVRLRAERSGKGSGRIYTIATTCTDASGNRSTAQAIVAVPKSQGK